MCHSLHIFHLQEHFSKDYPTCIAERGIQLAHTAMADTSKFKEETLQRCIAYCLENHPDKGRYSVVL